MAKKRKKNPAVAKERKYTSHEPHEERYSRTKRKSPVVRYKKRKGADRSNG